MHMHGEQASTLQLTAPPPPSPLCHQQYTQQANCMIKQLMINYYSVSSSELSTWQLEIIKSNQSVHQEAAHFAAIQPIFWRPWNLHTARLHSIN